MTKGCGRIECPRVCSDPAAGKTIQLPNNSVGGSFLEFTRSSLERASPTCEVQREMLGDDPV